MDSAAGLGNYFLTSFAGRATVLLGASIASTVFIITVVVAGIVSPGPETVVMAPFRW